MFHLNSIELRIKKKKKKKAIEVIDTNLRLCF